MIQKTFSIPSSIILSLTLVFSACGTTNSTRKASIILGQDATITQEGEASSKYEKGQSVELHDKPLLIESPGFVGAIAIPFSDTTTRAELKLKPLDLQGGKVISKKLNQYINELAGTLNEVQRLLSNQQADQALARVDESLRKHPEVTWMNFLKASCLVVKGEKQRAVAVLESALADFPNDASGLDLYEALSGRPYVSRKNNSKDADVD